MCLQPIATTELAVFRSCLLVAMATLLMACSNGDGARSKEPSATGVATTATSPARAAVAESLPSFVPLIEANGSAVVNIEVVQRGAETPARSEGDPFADFYRRYGGMPVPRGGPGSGATPMRGEGSGFIVT